MSRFLRLTQVIDATGLTEPTIYRLMANSEFPKSIKIGPRATAWVEDEIAEWQQNLIAKRDRDVSLNTSIRKIMARPISSKGGL